MKAEWGPESEGARPPRVVHVITNLDPGGAETSLLELGRGLGGELEMTVVALLERGALAGELEAAGVRVVALGWGRSLPGPAGLARLVRVLAERAPDVVQGWMYHGNLAAWAARRWLRSPAALAWNLRQTPGDWESETALTAGLIRAGAVVADQADVVVVNSLASRHGHAALGYRPARWEWIPNGFDLSRFRPYAAARARVRGELGAGPGERLVGLVARVHAIKGQRRFLEAAAMLGCDRDDVSFVLAGRDAEAAHPEIARSLTELGLEGRVRCVGERRDISDLMNALDIVCLASTSESFPNTVGEAMACGRPVVSTPVGDVARLVGEEGVVAADLSARSLAAGIARLLAVSPQERAALGARARRRIELHFGNEPMLERYRALYWRLAARAA